MAAMRQYFWLWLGLSIIILNIVAALIFYLICRRLGYYRGKMKIKKFFSVRSQTNMSQLNTCPGHTQSNAYQLENTDDEDNTVNKSLSVDNISHSYEIPPEFEKISNSGYIDVHPEDNESYDDVIAPGWVDEDYDDIA
ncbi:hypothetical protein chiPu_0020559 [Chiloscyllium punctatum]|uniref:SLP adapter and CSK-interacting membrane protein n=1 Tax=Chiloscyllium punctatum TaxID=137246 RepID=A0A401RGX8_CHIPU|nr:hypothetical protein [Chiloscyllium punctatum]